jgi:hypothetical protein
MSDTTKNEFDYEFELKVGIKVTEDGRKARVTVVRVEPLERDYEQRTIADQTSIDNAVSAVKCEIEGEVEAAIANAAEFATETEQ